MPQKKIPSSKNLAHQFLQSVDTHKDRTCFLYKKGDVWEKMTWHEAEKKVQSIALGLKAVGVKKGDMVAIFSTTRVEWTLSDIAILSLGAVTVPIYQSNTAEQAGYIIQNSESKVILVEDKKLLDRVTANEVNFSCLQKVILFCGKSSGTNVMTLEQLMALGHDDAKGKKAWRENISHIEPTQLATLVYTSGTTGPPKGAMLTHGNFLAEVQACQELFNISDQETSIVFLPLAHILARVMQFFQLAVGFEQAYAESIDKLIDNLSEVKPHFFVAVPRIFEKVYERVISQVEAGSPAKKILFQLATQLGKNISAKRQKKQMVWPHQALLGELASRVVFSKLRARLGGRLKYAVSGGAPLAQEIAEFFDAAGILILEGYGLTETSAAINCNTTSHYRFGTVGHVISQAKIKIASDGEICVKGPVVFQGYYKDKEATEKVLGSDGWFKTGDIGVIDNDGFLKITDRKKDIIVTAGGKNIAPQNIENLLKTIPLISQVMVHGDRRKYLSALVTLTPASVEEFAKKEGIAFASYPELVSHPKIQQMIKHSIDEKNKTMASYESIKKFAILSQDFTQETGELTPTLKVKRKFVTDKYKDVIESLYQDN